MKKRKKILVGYGNKHATKMVFAQIYPFYYEKVEIPLILKKPHATCNKKVRITIEKL